MNGISLDLPILVVLAFLVLAIFALLTWTTNQKRQSAMLRERFGPEYNRTLQEVGDRKKAEAELVARAKRVEAFHIHPLSTEQRDQFLNEWRSTQAHFVDDPAAAVRDADRLVGQVMEKRGYPMGSYEQRAADVSVDHADVVENYRAAHKLAQQNERGQASTEDLRQAMVYYRRLFNDLLDTGETEPVVEEKS